VLGKEVSPPGEKNNLKKEQVRKGGLPPLRTDINDRTSAGVNRPSLLVLFEVLLELKAYLMLLRPALFRC